MKEVLDPLTYQLQHFPQWKIYNVFHATLLTLNYETKAHEPNFAYSPPNVVEGEKQWKSKAIIQYKKYERKVKGKLQHYKFLIKWKGYPTSISLWKSEQNLKDAQKVFAKYK